MYILVYSPFWFFARDLISGPAVAPLATTRNCAEWKLMNKKMVNIDRE